MMISAVKDDTEEVHKDTEAIKATVSRMSSLFQEIHLLRLQVTQLQENANESIVLQRFLDESEAYTESVMDPSDNEHMSLSIDKDGDDEIPASVAGRAWD
jgi:hypothetical protein